MKIIKVYTKKVLCINQNLHSNSWITKKEKVNSTLHMHPNSVSGVFYMNVVGTIVKNFKGKLNFHHNLEDSHSEFHQQLERWISEWFIPAP